MIQTYTEAQSRFARDCARLAKEYTRLLYSLLRIPNRTDNMEIKRGKGSADILQRNNIVCTRGQIKIANNA